MPHARNASGNRCVAEMMKTALLTITPDTFVASASRLAAEHGSDYLLVLDEGSLTGIVCEADLHRRSRTGLVSECMSSPVYCVRPETTLEEAATIMDENSIGCLPVVADSFLVGLVTEDDLCRVGLGERTACAVCHRRRVVRRNPRAAGAELCRACASQPYFRRSSRGTAN